MYAIGEMISIIISTGVRMFWMSRKITFRSEKTQFTPIRAMTFRSQITGSRTIVQLRVPTMAAPVIVTVSPTTIVA